MLQSNLAGLVKVIRLLVSLTKEFLCMATDPVIVQDVSDLEDALATFTGSNGALPGLKAAVDTTTSAYNAGLAQAASDKANVDAKLTKLTTDVATVESGGTLTPPAPPAPPTVPGGGGDSPPLSQAKRPLVSARQG